MAALNPDLLAKLDAYLLGQLSSGEQRQIEALLFEDEDVFDAIRDAEDDLIDRYLAGELAAADRAAFEHTFANSRSRQERIAFARALAHDLASRAPAQDATAPVVVEAAGSDRASRGFAMRRWMLTGGATAAAAVAIAIFWQAGLAPRNGGAGSTSPSPGTGAASGAPANSGVPPAPGGTVQVPPGGPAIATFVLRSMELRRSTGNLPRVRVPEGTTAIRFEPEIETPLANVPYAVTLRRVEGAVVWEGTASAELGRLSVTVPARIVVPGDYLLRVAAPGVSPDDSAEYPFRVSIRD